MTLLDMIEDKEQLKNNFIKITYFIALYENFKSNCESNIKSLYANSVNFENNEIKFELKKLNDNNPKALIEHDLVKDKEQEEKYLKEVYRQCKKSNGNGYNHTNSLFKWLQTNNFIEKEQFDELLEIVEFRNKLVHKLDDFLENEFPKDLDEKINKLIEIRKYFSKKWFLEVEYSTSGEQICDEEGNVIIHNDAYSSSDLLFDLLHELLFK